MTAQIKMQIRSGNQSKKTIQYMLYMMSITVKGSHMDLFFKNSWKSNTPKIY